MTSANTTPVDVIVVGAGFAGLQAARDLENKCFRVQVLEARDRVGSLWAGTP
ncbi:MAG: FAD-dependent oxidoreductase [Gammaproteobacteria bacterium]